MAALVTVAISIHPAGAADTVEALTTTDATRTSPAIVPAGFVTTNDADAAVFATVAEDLKTMAPPGAAVGVAVGLGVGVAPPGVAVAVGAGVDVGVGVGVVAGAPPLHWITSSTLLVAASAELKVNPSEPALSIASDRKEPALLATAEVIGTCRYAPVVEPGVNVVTVAPLAGRLLNVSALSVQLLSATCLMFWRFAEPLVTNIRRVACEMFRPASGRRSNFIYDSRRGEMSDCRSVVWPKLLPASSPAT